jgi:hypothetical protein
MDQASEVSEYQLPINAYEGCYQLRVNKDLILNCKFIKNGNSSFEIKPFRYHFLGKIVSKINLINLIIELWPY